MTKSSYHPPADVHRVTVAELLSGARKIPPGQGSRLALPGLAFEDLEPEPVYYAARPLVALVTIFAAKVGEARSGRPECEKEHDSRWPCDREN